MAENIGQFYYNVEQIEGEGSNTRLQTISNITTNQIFNSNIVEVAKAARFTRLGIQAPPGTKVVINRTHNIIIGRTGLYELEADITHLYFVRTIKYIKDEDAIKLAKYKGSKMMLEAEQARINNMRNLPSDYIFPTSENAWSDRDERYWDQYINYENLYINGSNRNGYEAGLAQYQKGKNGIYKLPNPDDESADENFVVLRNVVIDYQYSTT